MNILRKVNTITFEHDIVSIAVVIGCYIIDIALDPNSKLLLVLIADTTSFTCSTVNPITFNPYPHTP